MIVLEFKRKKDNQDFFNFGIDKSNNEHQAYTYTSTPIGDVEVNLPAFQPTDGH